MSPQELVAAEWEHLRELGRAFWEWKECEYHGSSPFAPAGADDAECIQCAAARADSMAEAAKDRRGMAEYLARWKRQ